MSAWNSFWFWLTILSIIGFVAVFITLQVETSYNPPMWIWYVYGVALILLAVGFILFCYQSAQHNKERVDFINYHNCTLPPMAYQEVAYQDVAYQEMAPASLTTSACSRPPRPAIYQIDEEYAPMSSCSVEEERPIEESFGAARLSSPTTHFSFKCK